MEKEASIYMLIYNKEVFFQEESNQDICNNLKVV